MIDRLEQNSAETEASKTVEHSPDAQRTGERISLAFILIATFGVACALASTQLIQRLKFPADSAFFGTPKPSLDIFSAIATTVYGVCLGTFLAAVRSRQFWASPGKVLASLFALMCVLDLALALFAAWTVHSRFQLVNPTQVTQELGYIAGIWYPEFSASLGYPLAIPYLVFVVFMSRRHRLMWRLVWCGFLLFDLLIVAVYHFSFIQHFPPLVRGWYFEIAIGIPIVALALAMCGDLLWRRSIDWWTGVIGSLTVGSYSLAVGIKLFA